MTYGVANWMRSEWGTSVKAALIVLVAVVLLEVVALLVAEIFGKKKVRSAVPATEEKPDETAATVAEATEPIPDTVATEASTGDEIEPEETAVFTDGKDAETGMMQVGDTYIKVRYNRSFTAMLVQADDALKGYYNDLRNELMRYGMKSRISWSNESWYVGRTTYAKFAIRGKTLSLYLALDPAVYEGTKYPFRNVSETAKYREVPMQCRIKSDRMTRWTKELIAALAEKHGLTRTDMPEQNFRPDYRDTTTLVKEKLIKLYYSTHSDKSRQELENAAAADLKIKDRAPRDFTTKLMRADNLTKARYSAVKNELLRYGMKPRISTAYESWYIGRVTYAKFAIRGKTLTLFMALDPAEFEGTKYNFRNVGNVNKYETVPMRVNLKSDRSVRWVKELLSVLAEKKEWARTDRVEEDYRYVKKVRKK